MTDESGFETEDELVVGEDFLDVFFGGLGVEGKDASETVFFGTVAVVGGDHVLIFLGLVLLQLEGFLLDAHVLTVPLLGEVVAVVDQAVARVQGHITAHHQVGRAEELLLLQGHSRVMGVDRLFRQLKIR